METETGSSVDEHGGAGTGMRGKHRILAQLMRLEQDIHFLEDELEKLEQTENVSTMCEELLCDLETIPDPLLPETNGPANPLWDRWFEGPQDPQGCRCRIL